MVPREEEDPRMTMMAEIISVRLVESAIFHIQPCILISKTNMIYPHLEVEEGEEDQRKILEKQFITDHSSIH